MSKRWYVVHAYSGFEKRVQRALRERVELSNFGDCFGEIMVPTEEVVEMRAGQKRRSERKFFPGYVLVQMELNDETWHLVKETPRVMGFIGGKADRPAPLSEAEAEAILDRIRVGQREGDAEDPVRAGRTGSRGGWPVQGVQRCGRGSELREKPTQCGGDHFRSFNARRTRLFTGGERLMASGLVGRNDAHAAGGLGRGVSAEERQATNRQRRVAR